MHSIQYKDYYAHSTTNMPTPKRKRNQENKTQMKIPRLSLPTRPENPEPMKSQPKKKSPNPHPHKNQQIFVKFGQEVHLLKHRGLLTTTRKPKPKKISKPEPTQETQPTHQAQPTTPCPRRKVSENFTEIFKMFNKANPSTQQEPGKPVPTSRPVKPKPKDTKRKENPKL